MRRLAIGVDDFKKIIKEDCYYIDKTKFIEDILEDGSGVKLINLLGRVNSFTCEPSYINSSINFVLST